MTQKQFFITIASILISIIIITGLYFWNFWKYPLSYEQSIWGSFGDYIGGILNPVLSFAAFILLLKSLSSQLDQINSNRLRQIDEDRDRRINILAPILLEIHSRIKENLKRYPTNSAAQATTNTRENGSHKSYWEVSDDLSLLYRFLLQLSNIDRQSPFLFYFRNQYLIDTRNLSERHYINTEIYEFLLQIQ